MFKQLSTPINMHTIASKVQNGTLRFDSIVQRGFVWDLPRKMLFIHSVLVGYPLPALFGAILPNGDISVLDGKQRCNTIAEFINDEFQLRDLGFLEYETPDGNKQILLENVCYSQLPEELKVSFNSATCTLYTVDGMSDAEISEMFYRLNNGRPLSAVEKTRVRAKSLKSMTKLSKHPIFEEILSEKARAQKIDLDIVMKAYILLAYQGDVGLDTKAIREIVTSNEISAEEEKEIFGIFETLYHTLSMIKQKSVKRMVKTKTHFLSILPAIKQAIEDNRSYQDIADWLAWFFTSNEGKTKSKQYNENSTSHTTDKGATKIRLKAVCDYYRQFFKDKK